MSIGNAAQTRLAYISEVTWGTTPATPTFKTARVTGESLNFDNETLTSDEIRADRNVSDLIRVGTQASGGFDFELTYGTFDDFLASLFYGAWATNVLKNGVVQSSLSMEKTFELGATDGFFRYTGMIANSMSLKMEARQLVTGSFDLMGSGGTVATAIIAGATYTAATSTPPLSASVDFGTLTLGGVTAPKVMGIDLSITNNLRAQPVVGSVGLAGIGSGRFEVSGTIRVYLEDTTAYALFLAGTASSLTFTLGTVTLNKYTITIPVIKFDTAKVVAGGNDQDVMAELTFKGLYDSGSSATVTVTRAVA